MTKKTKAQIEHELSLALQREKKLQKKLDANNAAAFADELVINLQSRVDDLGEENTRLDAENRIFRQKLKAYEEGFEGILKEDISAIPDRITTTLADDISRKVVREFMNQVKAVLELVGQHWDGQRWDY